MGSAYARAAGWQSKFLVLLLSSFALQNVDARNLIHNKRSELQLEKYNTVTALTSPSTSEGGGDANHETSTIVDVSITGRVEGNGVREPPLSGVPSGTNVTLAFHVNSSSFEPVNVDGFKNSARAYPIDQSSFSLTFVTNPSITIPLLSPFPNTTTPYFTLAHGEPFADGFWVSQTANSPGGVPLQQQPLNAGFEVHFNRGTLASLDITKCLGSYNYTGLTSFGYTLWALIPDNVAMEINYIGISLSSR